MEQMMNTYITVEKLRGRDHIRENNIKADLRDIV
jgi:hypothetical protein